MCARVTQAIDTAALARELGLASPPTAGDVWNGTPGRSYLIARAAADGAAETAELSWGLRPSWSRDERFAPVNARSETAGIKPSFREAFRRRRALLPVSGWFEWGPTPQGRAAHYIDDPESGIIYLAAIWEPPQTQSGTSTFAVLTTSPRAELARIHDRQPSIVETAEVGDWLSSSAGRRDVLARGQGRRALRVRRMGPAVNDPTADLAPLLAGLA